MRIEEVHYCLRCGTALQLELQAGQTRPTCPACGWIFFPDPKVAVATVVLQDQQVLLVRRVNPPMRGYWTLPAGFLDAGEDPVHAAERECREETGLKVRIVGFEELLAGQAHPRGADLLLVYKAEVYAGNLQPGDDADQAAFFPFHDLPPLAFESTRQILSHYQENETLPEHPSSNP